MATLMMLIIAVIFLIISAGVYFLPAIVAKMRNNKDFTAILVLNIFLGWTLLGWVVALVWAFKTE